MMKRVNHNRIHHELNKTFDYQHAQHVFLKAINSLTSDEKFNQYEFEDVVDAFLCIDMQQTELSVDTLVQLAKNILTSNEYHPQRYVINFSTLVLLKYAIAQNERLDIAARNFMSYELFYDMSSSYLILHTGSLGSVATSMRKRIALRKNAYESAGIERHLSKTEQELVSLLPEFHVPKDFCITNAKHVVAKLYENFGTTIPTGVAALAVSAALVENKDVIDVLSEFPLQEILDERARRASNLFKAFVAARAKHEISIKEWFFVGHSCAMLVALADSTDEETIERINAFIVEDVTKRKLEAEEMSKQVRARHQE